MTGGRLWRLGALLLVWLETGPGVRGSSLEVVEYFESRIRPVLAQDCYECHQTGGKSKGGLVLDHRAGLLEGGRSGPALIPGNVEESLILRAIRHDSEDLQMPKAGVKLDPEIIADFERWVAMGAPDPRDAPPSEEELAADRSWDAILERRKSWWSFQPVGDPVPPVSSEADHPVDAFVRERLDEAGLRSVGEASPERLARRLYLVLTGLPPAPEEVQRFVAAWWKDSDQAFETKVDELLASPHFGERWARHWMDWLRYAESHGSEGDPAVPYAWRYRDYLIRALNADVPYDQLVREHLAGDLLPEPRINEGLGLSESAIGPAHLRMVFHGFSPTDALEEKVRFVDDQINVVTKGFLGLTVSCARCHDHKFDAISQADYYAMFGIFASPRLALIDANLPGHGAAARAEMASLKEEIRPALARYWLREVESIATRLETKGAVVEPKGKEKGKDKDASGALVRFWREAREDGAAFERRWMGRVESLSAAQSRAEGRVDRSWSGPGLIDAVAEGAEPHLGGWRQGGEFALALSGETMVRGIYPAGVYSHLISDRDRGMLGSDGFEVEAGRVLWLRVAGEGEALVRYAVQDYPRRGTIYPVERLEEGDWDWVRFELDYWKGDRVHWEVTTAADSPVLARINRQRSWFGIREAVLAGEEYRPGTRSDDEILEVLIGGNGDAPQSAGELAERYVVAIGLALKAWARGQATDGQALLLDAALRDDLLTNRMEAMGEVADRIRRYRELETSLPVPKRVPGLVETGGRDQPFFPQGNHKQPGEPVPRRFLEAFAEGSYGTAQSGRLELARELVDGGNPLVSRVIVNRVWHHLFGEGPVRTPDNFGRMGSKPSHPELLDYLARRFVEEDDWSLKRLIRFLVVSQTWRQDSRPDEKALQLDPENVWLSHYSVRRLEAEAIRDAMLAVSGQLDTARYGEPVDGNSRRRSIYVNVIRNRLDPFLTAFDAPVPFSTTGRRAVTNVPAQSLLMMNHPFVVRAAETLASRTTGEAEVRSRIERLWWLGLGRAPVDEEIEAAELFLASAGGESGGPSGQAWRDLAHSVLNLKEFIYVQ